MIKKKELWLAFAEDELTCTVSVYERPDGTYLEITLNGTLTPARIYVWDLIMDVAEHTDFETIILNVRNLSFFSGNTINDCAIDLLLRFVKTFSQTDKQLHVQLEDSCIKQVFAEVLPERKFRSLHFEDKQAVLMANSRLQNGRAAPASNVGTAHL